MFQEPKLRIDTNQSILKQLYEQIIPGELLVSYDLSTYGVKAIDTSGNAITSNTPRKDIRIIGQNEKVTHTTGYVGSEIEVNLSYDIYQLREAKWRLDSMFKFSGGYTSVIKNIGLKSYETFHLLLPEAYASDPSMKINSVRFLRYYLTETTKAIFNKTCPLLFKEAHVDAAGVECSLYPMTELAYTLLKSEFIRIFDIYKILGFTDIPEGAGVHTYIDYILFGEDKAFQIEGIKRFLWFLFNNGYHMSKISCRKFEDSLRSDIYHLLGDDVILCSSSDLKNKFLSIKDDIINGFIKGNRIDSLNMIINKSPKDSFGRSIGSPIGALEYRWWAATTNPDTFMAYIEFGFIINKFLKSLKEYEKVTFNDFYLYLENSGEGHNLAKLIQSKLLITQ